MSKHYILNKDHSVREADLIEWAEFFNDMNSRRVALDRVGDAFVSTVFLGLDHSFGEGPPLIFETLISGGAHDQDMWRYSTWDEAVEGHRAALAQAGEAGTAETTKIGSVHEHAVPEGNAP